MNLFKELTSLLLDLTISILCLNKKIDYSKIIFASSKNENYTFNSKYLFEYFLNNNKNLDIKFVINNDMSREKLNKKYGNYFIETKTIKGKRDVLLSGVWVLSEATMPVNGINLAKKRLIYHIGHGTPLKNIYLKQKSTNFLRRLYYKLIKSSNFTYVQSNSEYLSQIMTETLGVKIEQIVEIGQPRNDEMFKEAKDLFVFSKYKNAKKILYAPTWRPYAKTKIFPFEDFDPEQLRKFLEEENIIIYIRKHPLFEFEVDNQIYQNDRIIDFNEKIAPEIMEYLTGFDIVITDFSSIYLDFLISQKPVLFIPYDFKQYEEEVGFSINYEKFTPGPKVHDFFNFKKEITKLIKEEKYYKDEREIVNRLINPHEGHSCLDNYLFLKEKIENFL